MFEHFPHPPYGLVHVESPGQCLAFLGALGTVSILLSLVTNAGVIQLSNGGTLSVESAAGLAVDFTGTGGNLVLGSSFTGTVNAITAADGPVTISGGGNVTTVTGDAVDLASSRDRGVLSDRRRRGIPDCRRLRQRGGVDA